MGEFHRGESNNTVVIRDSVDVFRNNLEENCISYNVGFLQHCCRNHVRSLRVEEATWHVHFECVSLSHKVEKAMFIITKQNNEAHKVISDMCFWKMWTATVHKSSQVSPLENLQNTLVNCWCYGGREVEVWEGRGTSERMDTCISLHFMEGAHPTLVL